MNLWEQIAEEYRRGSRFVVITITSGRGSIPGMVGGKAIVSTEGLIAGNLGGVKVEARAIEHAVAMLSNAAFCDSVMWNLQNDIGMTCGGEMGFLFERVDPEPLWQIGVFGAGHVSQALVKSLSSLACCVDVFDTRPEWLAKFSKFENVTLHLVDRYETGVDHLQARSFAISITPGHSSDVPVVREALIRFPEIPYLGVIGSTSKRALLFRQLRDDGIEEAQIQKIFCPAGLPIGGNDPAEIAISIVAQMLEIRGRG